MVKKFFGLLILIMLVGAGYYGYQYYWPSNETAVQNPQNVQMVYMEGIPQTQRDVFMEKQGALLLKVSFIENHSDARFFWDSDEAILEVTTLDSVYRFQPDSAFYLENNQQVGLTVPLTMVANEPYLPMEFIESTLSFNWIYREEDQMLILEEERDCRLVAEIIVEEAVLREKPSIKAPYFQSTLVPGDQLVVYETYEKWLKIRTEDGAIGFIHKKDVKRYEECRPKN